MKSSKIFIGLAAFSLAIGSFIVTKANRKFATFNIKFIAANGLSAYSGTASTTLYTSVRPTAGNTVLVRTATGGQILATMLTSGGAKKVYHK
jgi:hypothetical protein